MYRVRWRKTALESLREAMEYIAEYNLAAADSVAARIFSAVDLIASQPEMYPERGRYRVCAAVRPYLIFYRVDDAARVVRIMEILHAAREYRPD